MRNSSLFENCKQTAEKCKQIFENWISLLPLKRTLALPTKGQNVPVLSCSLIFLKFFNGTPFANFLGEKEKKLKQVLFETENSPTLIHVEFEW